MEARSGSFVYRDAFFAEVDVGKRHPRASVTELKELLLPKRSSLPAKDQVAHFYEAQLLHYGLPRTKEKNAAKVRLTSALNAGNLSVPSNVQHIEADLKKEYATLQRRAKLVARKEQDGLSTPASASKKRRATDPIGAGSTTKLSVKVGDMTIELDHQAIAQAQSVAKRQKKTAEPKGITSPKKQTARKTTTNRPQANPRILSSSPANPPLSSTQIGNHVRPKQTARRRYPFNPSTARSMPSHSSAPMSHYDNEDEDVPPPYTEYHHDDDSEDGPNSDGGGPVQISGVYSIYASSDDYSDELIIRLSNARDQMWARFTIGHIMGVIRLDRIDGIGQSMRKTFGWRSEDTQTGQLRFSKDCDGWIEFNGRGGVRGEFHGLFHRGRHLEFEGGLDEDLAYESEDTWSASIEDMATEWHDFPNRAYGRR